MVIKKGKLKYGTLYLYKIIPNQEVMTKHKKEPNANINI
ncbi:MAG: hypothetical protein RL711_2011, partial [Bacteroidota bacterium]